MNDHPLTVSQILSAISRHKMRVFLVWVVVMCIVVAGYIIWPRKYASEGQLYVKMDRNNTSVKPSNAGNQVAIQDTRETELRSVAEIVRSHAVLDSVVDDVGADRILDNSLFSFLPKITLPSFGSKGGGDMSPEEYQALRQKELAVKELRENLEVFIEKKTSILRVELNAVSAKLAREIVESIFENTRRVHLRIHNVSNSVQYFDEQFAEHEQKVVTAVTKLSDFRKSKKVHSIGAARDTFQGILTIIEQNLVSAEVALQSSRERLDKLGQLLTTTKDKVDLPRSGVERLSYEDSQTELFKLKSERERMKLLYRPGNPKLDRIEAQVVQLESTLKGMTADRTESSLQSNPVYEAIQVDQLKAKAEVAAAERRVSELEMQKLSTLKRLEELNEDEVVADQLLRNVQVARQYLAIYTQKRGESRAMEKHDAENISDVIVWQDPTLAAKHRTPKGSLIIPLGCLCGLFAGFAVALYSDRNHLSGTLNESEVEQILELPVLVTLPRVYSSRNMVS